MNYLKLRKLATAKSVSVFVGFAMTLSLVGGAAMPAQAATVEELTAQIASLLATISSLQSQLSTMTGGTTSTGVSYTFTRNLKQGMSGEDVMNLQKVLNMSADTQVAASGVGSAGNESSYFGGLTKAAVIKFQNKYASEVLAPVGLTMGTGYVGASTRAKLNTMGGVATTPTTPTTPGTVVVPAGTGLTVTAASQPAASLAPQSTSRVPFTKFTLTASADGDITVNSVTVERTGLANDAVFSGVSLLDEDGTQLGLSKSLSSTHQATVGEEFVVKAGTSKTMTIAGNMAASLTTYAGQVVSLSLVSVNTSAAVSGALPITGAGHTVNATLTVGTADPARGSLDPNGAQTKEIGTTGYTFSSVRVTAGSAEKVRLHSIRWNQSGSASKDDLANVKTYVDGTVYPTVVSADGKYYTASFGSGIVIDKGLQKEITIKGDIVSGSARTIAFDLYKNTDLYVTGETYGYGITPSSTGTGFATTNPWYNASVVTVSAGSVNSISKSNTVAAQNIAILSANQPLGGFEVEVKGEPVSVQQMIFNITTDDASGTSVTPSDVTSISLVDGNGSVIAGPVDASGSTSQKSGTITFTDTVTFPVGKTVLTLKGQLSSDFATNDTVAASTTPSSQWTTVRGEDTGDTISLSSFSSAVTANTMTVKAGSLAISVSSQPSARNVIAGSKGFEFARYILDASQSGEDVKLTTFIASTSLSTITASQLSNCNLYDGTDPITDETNVTLAVGNNTFTFDNGGLIVPKGTQKSLSMRCDLSTGATSGIVYWGVYDNATAYTSAVAVGSGQTVTETWTAALGQAMTAATSGSYTVTNDTSLLYKAAQAGSTGVTLAKLRFTAGATEAVDLKQIALQLGNTASNSPADLVGERVSIWNGSTQIGTAQFGGSNADNATSTQLSPAPRIQPGESVLLTIKGDLTSHNVNEGTPGAFLAITYDGQNNGINGNYATGVDSQVTVNGGTTSDVTTNGLRIFRTVPTIAVTSNGTAVLTAGANLYTFTVTNPNNRDVVFKKFSMSLATSGSAVINAYTLYGDGVAFNTATSTINAETLIEFIADTTSQAKIVPANSTKTYTVRAGTVTNPSTTVVDSVTFALLADTAYPALADNMGTYATVDAATEATSNNIIWSPFSTTTPVATQATEENLDWTNGYGLPGFPSNTSFTTQTFSSTN